MTATKKRTVYWICGVVTIVCIGLVLKSVHDTPSTTWQFTIPPNTPLTEELALKFSREALEKYGVSSHFMQPEKMTWSEKQVYFLRNVINPDRGMVRWGLSDGRIFDVWLEKNGDVVTCNIRRPL